MGGLGILNDEFWILDGECRMSDPGWGIPHVGLGMMNFE
jgi:hypothetical protein